jgi:hypothetical protein
VLLEVMIVIDSVAVENVSLVVTVLEDVSFELELELKLEQGDRLVSAYK